MGLSKGEKFYDRYVIVEQISSGGFGSTYLAYDTENDLNVCLKTLTNVAMGTSSLPQEAHILRKLDHTNIIKILDYHSKADSSLPDTLVTEFVEGSDLLDHYYDGNMPYYDIDRKHLILTEVLDALIYLEENNIVHNDLKMDNLLIDTKGQVKLIDFGLSAKTNTENYLLDEKYKNGWILGKDPFSDEVDNLSDIYSFGILFFYIIAHKLPNYNLPYKIDFMIDDEYTNTNLLHELFLSLTHSDRNKRPSSFKEVKSLIDKTFNQMEHKDIEHPDLNLGDVGSIDDLVKKLTPIINPQGTGPRFQRIDGQEVLFEDKFRPWSSNTTPYIKFHTMDRYWKIHGDTYMYALRNFLLEALQNSPSGTVQPENFLIVKKTYDGTMALRLKSNFIEKDKRYRANGFYCYEYFPL